MSAMAGFADDVNIAGVLASTNKLKDNDLSTAIRILLHTFESQLSSMVNSTLSGVIKGINGTIITSERENDKLREKVEKLDTKANETIQSGESA